VDERSTALLPIYKERIISNGGFFPSNDARFSWQVIFVEELSPEAWYYARFSPAIGLFMVVLISKDVGGSTTNRSRNQRGNQSKARDLHRYNVVDADGDRSKIEKVRERNCD
jgi:hypothetical protein